MSNVTFVCCIESGGLEEMTLRMIASLRRWGGQYKDAAIIAVRPRMGSPLSKRTLKILDSYDVMYLYSNVNTESWFKYMNKPHALNLADEFVQTEFMCWIDSDIIFLDEPFQSVTSFKNDVYACASDKNIGSTGEADKFDPYWQYLCAELNIDINQMPWIVTEYEQHKIRLYFNSGVFLYRKSSHFSKQYLNVCQRLLRSKIANTESGIFFTDQVALGLTVCTMNLSYMALPLADNFPINRNKVLAGHDLSGDVSILHYHDMMWQPNWPNLLTILEQRDPEVLDWLNELGPTMNNSNFAYKVVANLLSKFRDVKLKSYLKNCHEVC
tara:strand:+ start:8028 stop:9005 length:978 start_codon:yes stop_codon:yes gene_type:complete